MANFSTWDRATLEQFAQEATDKLVELRKAQGVPVAWRYKIVQPAWTYSDKMPDKSFAGSCWDDWEVTPLYTSAPPIPEGEPEIRWVYHHEGNDRIAGTPTVEDALEYLSARKRKRNE